MAPARPGRSLGSPPAAARLKLRQSSLPSVVPSTARSQDFAGGILPFEATAAARYADIVPARRQAGNPIEGFDAPIAATALAREASVATRDTGGFSACGHTLIGTWTV